MTYIVYLYIDLYVYTICHLSSSLSPKLCELADFDPRDYHNIGALKLAGPSQK